jgi:nucleotide-binding universal stress UspA family protein
MTRIDSAQGTHPIAAGFREILVATDFGEASTRALSMAIELSTKCGGEHVTMLHVYEIPVYAYPGVPPMVVDFAGRIRQAAEKRMAQELGDLKKQWPDSEGVLCVGVPWQEILKQADERHADLIVMGTHGRRGLESALMGSVAEKIVRMSPVPVVTVH